VGAGGAFFSPRFVERQRELTKTPGTFEKTLSPREQELLRYLGAGFTDAEIAATLGLSASTAQTHRRNVMEKLDLHTAKDLLSYALKSGFTTPDRLR
jgi:DNA-binding NarL/FixJ family response regulator